MSLKRLGLLLGFLLSSQFFWSQELDSLSYESLKEVSLRSKKTGASKVVSGEIELTEKEIDNTPITLGERDIFKWIQRTPGVQQGSEGQSGLLVRGGNSGMNLTFLDGIYLHNSSHLGGIFSLINSDFVQKLKFHKSGFDAQFGGRLSSVTEVTTKTNFKDFFVKSSVGLLTSKITLGVPLKTLDSKLLISGRRTYLDLIQPLFLNDVGNETTALGEGKSYFFYDYLIKSQSNLGDKNQLDLLYYETKDQYTNDNEAINTQSHWQNSIYGMHFKSNLNRNLKNDFFLSKSQYQLFFSGFFHPINYDLTSNYQKIEIKDRVKLKLDQHRVSGGVSFEQIQNLPKLFTANIEDNAFEIANQQSFQYSYLNFFLDDEFEPFEDLKFKIGLRYSNFNIKASTLFNTYQNGVFEPRLSVNYEFKDQEYVKFSYQNLNQFEHQSFISTYSTPIDFFLPSHQDLKPQKVNQWSLSYAKVRALYDFEISPYYKTIDHYTEFLQGSLNTLFLENLYDDIVAGNLFSYGVEFSTAFKINHKLNGNLNYTFSRTKAKFNDVNNGAYFPVVFDRPHNLNTSLNYKWSSKIDLGMSFIFTSGQNFTPPEFIRIIDGTPIITFGQRNSRRYPNYHRLDLYANVVLKKTVKKSSKLNFTLYNVYNRKNPFFITYNVGGFEQSMDGVRSEIETLFPLIPTITWIYSYK